MSDMVWVAVLGLVGTVFGGFAGFSHKSRKQAIEDAEREQRQADQYNRIEAELLSMNKRLDEHNGYAEKFADAGKNLAVISERQAAMSDRIERLQKDIDFLKSDRCKV